MLGPKNCPICEKPSAGECPHLCLASEARDFVRRCIESCRAQSLWQNLCERRRARLRASGDWSPEAEDFTWLETAFCDQFLKRLRWFAGMDYEWRTTGHLARGGFWILLWSKEPRRFWWELRDEIERQASESGVPQPPAAHAEGPWLLSPIPERPR